MASSRKVIWHVPNVGQLRALKKDPDKICFYVEAWHQNPDRKRRGPYFFSVRDPRIPIWWIERRIKEISEDFAKAGKGYLVIYGERTERALDFLFAELSRRAPKPVVG